MTPVYLDHNATAPIKPAVADAMMAALGQAINPSSVHSFGRAARKMVERAREQLADAVGATPAGIVFTSGATEANQTALSATGAERILVSAVEHASVLHGNPRVEVIPVDAKGQVDLAALAALLAADPRPTLVSVMLVNNETGVVQPVAEVVDLAQQHGALVHCDAVQAFGKLPLNLRLLDADLVSFSAHKLGGPPGVGALILRETLTFLPFLRGSQEKRRRGGTENVPAIVGFGVAADLAAEDVTRAATLRIWRDGMERRLLERFGNRVRIHGADTVRVANTSCIGLPGLKAETQVMRLDLAGIAVSAGSACSSGKVAASHVLSAAGVPEDEALSAIRVSLGWSSTEEDVERFLNAYSHLAERAEAVA